MPLTIVDDHRESAFAQAQTGLLFNLPAPPAERAQLPAGVTLCMIVKNEERFLAECLESVAGVIDEICIVDTGSIDRTVEIALAHGARVEHHAWRDDFAWAKNKAVDMATRRWILVLDGDEEIAPESLAQLRALRETPAGEVAVYVSIRNLIEDEAGDATMTHMLPRIFPNTPSIRYRNRIHETISLNGGEVPVVVSPVVVIHKGYTKAILAAKGKTKRNAPLLERAIEDGGDEEYAYFNFGTAAITSGDSETGIVALEKSFERMTTIRSFHSVAYAMLGTALAEARGDMVRANEVLDEGIERCAQHPTLLFTKGYILSLERRFDEARAMYERAIAMQADARRHYVVDDEIRIWKAPLNLGVTYLKEGRHAEALPWFERAFAAKPNSTRLRSLLSRCYEQLDRAYDAERLLRDSDESEIAVELINFLLRRRRFDEALERVDRAVALPPRAIAALQLSAAVAMRDGRLGDPEPYARRALALAPGFGQALTFLDAWYASVGNEQARSALRAAELDAPLVELADFTRRVHRLLEDGDSAAAADTADLGIALAPRDPLLRYNAALACARAGRDADALAHLDAIDPSATTASSALVLRAEILIRGGDLSGAVAAFDGVPALVRPDATVIRNGALELARSLIGAGRVEDAARVAQRALG